MEEPPSPSRQRHRSGRIVGIDFGTVRIGIAVSDLDQKIATPWETYTRKDLASDAKHFKHLAIEEAIHRFVVGLPVHLDGQESQKSREARQFGKWLGEITNVPVMFFDERFTTVEAEQLLQEAGLTKKKRKARLDMLAAQIMLQAYLDSGAKDDESTAAIDD